MALKSLAGKADENAQGVEMETRTPGEAPTERKASKHKSFDDVPAQGSGIPDGKYTAILSELVLQDADPEKGESVRFKVMICDDNHQGEEITGWWKLWADDKRNDVAGGAQFFKRFMALLDMKVTEASLEADINEVHEAHPAFAIQKKTNGNFENVYFNGLVDDDAPIVRATREAHPF